MRVFLFVFKRHSSCNFIKCMKRKQACSSNQHWTFHKQTEIQTSSLEEPRDWNSSPITKKATLYAAEVSWEECVVRVFAQYGHEVCELWICAQEAAPIPRHHRTLAGIAPLKKEKKSEGNRFFFSIFQCINTQVEELYLFAIHLDARYSRLLGKKGKKEANSPG